MRRAEAEKVRLGEDAESTSWTGIAREMRALPDLLTEGRQAAARGRFGVGCARIALRKGRKPPAGGEGNFGYAPKWLRGMEAYEKE